MTRDEVWAAVGVPPGDYPTRPVYTYPPAECVMRRLIITPEGRVVGELPGRWDDGFEERWVCNWGELFVRYDGRGRAVEVLVCAACDPPTRPTVIQRARAWLGL